MPLQKATDRIERLILEHDKLKTEARDEILAGKNDTAKEKQDAAERIKQRFVTFAMNKVALVTLKDDGTPRNTVANAEVQGIIRDYLDEVDWSGLVEKYWDSVRGS